MNLRGVFPGPVQLVLAVLFVPAVVLSQPSAIAPSAGDCAVGTVPPGGTQNLARRLAPVFEVALRCGRFSVSRERLAELGPLAECPPGNGFRPLTNMHPPDTVFVGYFTSDKDDLYTNAPYVRALGEIIQRRRPGVKLKVLVPEGSQESARKNLAGAFEEPCSDMSLAVVPAKDVSWPQDWLEFGLRGAHPVVRGLPSRHQDGNAVTCVLCPKLEIAWEHGTEGHGGNIEGLPGGLTVFGNHAPSTEVDGPVVTVDTSFLQVGHVDELYSSVPTDGPGPCNYAILYASPALGLKLLDQVKNVDSKTPMEPPNFLPGTPTVTGNPSDPDCIRGLSHASAMNGGIAGFPVTAGELAGCRELVQQNERLEASLRKDAHRIATATGELTGCRDPQIVPLPVLFWPAVKERLGPPPRTGLRAINPNPVNSLVLDRNVIVGEQPNQIFRNAVTKQFDRLGVGVDFIDAGFYHHMGGTVHCSTNTLRACVARPR